MPASKDITEFDGPVGKFAGCTGQTSRKSTSDPEIEKLIERSRNSFLHEKDAGLSEKMRLSALDDAFLLQMIGACEKYWPLMKEMLSHPRRDHLAGSEAILRLSLLHGIYLEISDHWSGGLSFAIYKSEWNECRWYYFAHCTVVEEDGKCKLFTPVIERTGEMVPYRRSCDAESYKDMRYFVRHYTDKWLYKAVTKELKKRIKVRERKARERVASVTS